MRLFAPAELDSLHSGAEFSPCRRYRFRLWRRWSGGAPVCCFILLNPSTADETKDDPTVRRCYVRAAKGGFSSLQVLNLFAFRATRPADLFAAADPVGNPQNDEAILQVARAADLVICAWGNHGRRLGRASQVTARLSQAGIRLHHLGLTGLGEPRHPLYLPYSATITEFRAGREAV